MDLEIHSKKHSKPDGAVLRCKYNMAPFSVKERKDLDQIDDPLKFQS